LPPTSRRAAGAAWWIEQVYPRLDLICCGLRRASTDDWEALARGALVYDALYAELSAGNLPNEPNTQGG
jgi:hypothetical protein